MTIDSKKKVMSMGITMTRVIEKWLYHTYTHTYIHIHVNIQTHTDIQYVHEYKYAHI